MEKKSIISSLQIILVLFVTRLLFSTSYQSVLHAGNSIQDILLSLPINLVGNFIVAIPLLLLARRYPGHDPIEATSRVAGKGISCVVGFLYFLFFLMNAAITAGNVENFFIATVIPDVESYIIGIFLLAVCLYGVLKGIETIARVGSVVAVIYIVMIILICIILIPKMDMGYVKPILYKGITYLKSFTVMNYNLSVQIVGLAFMVPFMRPEASPGKAFTAYNFLSFAILSLLEFAAVTVIGAYGAQQLYPLQTLASLTSVSDFERLDTIDMVSWILNAIITTSIYLYLAVMCLLKLGLNKHRKITAFISTVAVLFAATFVAHRYTMLQEVMIGGTMALVVTAFTIIIPLFVLLIDLIKGKGAPNAQNNQNNQNNQNSQNMQS